MFERTSCMIVHHSFCTLSIVLCIATGNRDLHDPEEIEKALKLGEYIKNGAFHDVLCLTTKSQTYQTYLISSSSIHVIHPPSTPIETLALYQLKKYRHLKRAYPSNPPSSSS